MSTKQGYMVYLKGPEKNGSKSIAKEVNVCLTDSAKDRMVNKLTKVVERDSVYADHTVEVDLMDIHV